MKRWLLMLICLLTSFVALAEPEINVETNPRDPVAGEEFQILFKVKMTGDKEPSIDFTPSGLKINGKQSQGISTKTVYQMGRITTTREVLIVYDAIANQAGIVKLNNLVAEVDGRRYTQNSVPIEVLAARKAPRELYVAVETSDREAYVGQGITIRYYIYVKTALTQFDIKKYPVLDGFMKRYLQENDRSERVSVNGEIWRRSLIYSARLYPEKAGKLVLDPMGVEASYSTTAGGAFGFAFGLGARDMKKAKLESAPVEITVKSLPAGAPSSFTGLVGKHKFELRHGSTKLLVNEPLTMKFTVTGPGALEAYEAPAFFNDSKLENFETTADLRIVDAENSSKLFDYTYLARDGGGLPSKDFELSYFDINTQRYVTEKVALPSITIAGSVTKTPIPIKPTKKSSETASNSDSQDTDQLSIPAAPQVSAPLSSYSTVILLIGIALSLLSGALVWQASTPVKVESDEWQKAIKQILKGEETYANVVRLVEAIESKTKSSPFLRQEADEILLKLRSTILVLSSAEFSENKTAAPPRLVDKTLLKKIQALLEKTYEDDQITG